MKIPEFGIELVIGLPGAGKSFIGVRRLMHQMLETRRPVYTNLPLRWRAVRRFLRHHGGEDLAKLIHPLSERHFRAFIGRYGERAAFLRQCKGEHPSWTEAQCEAAWYEHAAADVMTGDDANWIPSQSIIAVDEVHHWFPNPHVNREAAKLKPEPKALLDYLTMHRHMMHWLWFYTQAERQVSQTFHTLATRVWEVHNRGDDQLAYWLRFRHLGLRPLGYRCWTAGHRELGLPAQHNFSIMPGMPWNRWVFKLYDSFTHAGSKAKLRRELKAAHAADGLCDGGKTEREVKVMAWQRTFLGRWFGRIRRATVLVIAVGLGVVMAQWYNAAQAFLDEREEVIEAEAITEGSEDDDDVIEERSEVFLASVTNRAIRLTDGTRLRTGELHNARELMHIDVDRGITVWRDDDDVYLMRIGDKLRRFASVDAVVGRFEGFANAIGHRPANADRGEQAP